MKKNKFIFYTISIVKYFSYEMLLFSIRGFHPYPVLLYHYIVSYRRDEKFQGDGKLKIYEFEKNSENQFKKQKPTKNKQVYTKLRNKDHERRFQSEKHWRTPVIQ